MNHHLLTWPGRSPRAAQAGFTLVELMIAMLLGLVVIAGVTSVFLANQQAYRTSHAIGQVQDGARTSFELMARDIRDAGLSGCGNGGRVANVLNNSATAWWANWNNVLMGYGGSQADPAVTTGTGTGNRVANTDSLMLLGGEGAGYTVKADSEPAATFTLNESGADLAAGDVVMMCDPDHATLVQLSSVAGGSYAHAKTAGTPGNCTTDLSYPTVCSSSASYVFATNAQVTRLRASDWFIGYNSTGGKSLYRVSLVNTGGVPTPTAEEVVRNAINMSITYHVAGSASFAAATALAGTDWPNVDAVRVHLWLQSEDQHASTNNQALQRDFVATTTLRNRVN